MRLTGRLRVFFGPVRDVVLAVRWSALGMALPKTDISGRSLGSQGNWHPLTAVLVCRWMDLCMVADRLVRAAGRRSGQNGDARARSRKWCTIGV